MKRREPDSTDKTAVLVGRGSMGSIFMDVAPEVGVRIVAVVTSTETLRTALVEHPDAAVIIASPKQFHCEQVKVARGFDRRILCEKPLGTSTLEVHECGQGLVAGFQRRRDRHFLAGKKACDKIGQVQLIRSISRDPPSQNVRDVTSIIWDSFVHDADVAVWFANSKPVKCSAVLSQQGTVTRFAAMIHFESGAVALCAYDQGIVYGYDQRVEIHGTTSTVFVENPLVNTSAISGADRSTTCSPLFNFYSSRYREAYKSELVELFDDFRIFLDHAPAHWCCERAMESIQSQTKFPIVRGPSQVASLFSGPVSRFGGGNVCRVALVGAGRMGQIRAEIMARNPRIQLLYVIDLRLSLAEELSQRLGSNITASAHVTDEIISKVDAVWICVGTAEHLDVIRRCKGQNVVVACEKPVSLNRDEIDEAFQLCPDLRVCFQRFYDPDFCWLIDNATKNVHGPKSFLGANGDHPCPPMHLLSSLGSIFHDLVIHDISLAVRILNSPPKVLHAVGSSLHPQLRGKNIFDVAALIFQCEDGSIAAFSALRSSAMGYDQRAEVVDSGRLFQVNNPQTLSCAEWKDDGIVSGTTSFSFQDRYARAYASEVDGLCDFVMLGKQPIGRYWAGLDHNQLVAAVCDAAAKSATSGNGVLLK